jgi:hypothetical protein
MKTSTYFQWFKDISDFTISPEILRVVAILVGGGNYSGKAISFIKYPPAISNFALILKETIDATGFDSGDPAISSFYNKVGNDIVIVTTVPLKQYDQSNIQFLSINGSLIGKIYNFIGENFMLLTISAQHWENVYITGDNQTLSNWDGFNSIPLSFAGGRGGPFWEIAVPLNTGETIEFKFLTPDHSITGLLVYEPGNNRSYTASDKDDYISFQI